MPSNGMDFYKPIFIVTIRLVKNGRRLAVYP
jgi:hypothetical protein